MILSWIWLLFTWKTRNVSHNTETCFFLNSQQTCFQNVLALTERNFISWQAYQFVLITCQNNFRRARQYWCLFVQSFDHNLPNGVHKLEAKTVLIKQSHMQQNSDIGQHNTRIIFPSHNGVCWQCGMTNNYKMSSQITSHPEYVRDTFPVPAQSMNCQGCFFM